MDKQPEAPWKYWAFLSYSHRDKRVADWLHKSLESYRLPKKLVGQINLLGSVPPRLFPVFRDREELPTSSDLGSQIQEALRQSRFIIVIASPHAAASRWVNEEIRYFKSQHGEDRVLCLIADGEPKTASGEPSGSAECFPPTLRFRVAEDGSITTNPVEPIAADIRVGGDGKSNSLLKIVAGLTGLAFDSLRQRDRERARKRGFGFAGGAVLVCAVALAFAHRLSQVERRQAKLEKSGQALGNINTPYLAMRLSDPKRQASIDAKIGTVSIELSNYSSWLFPTGKLNSKFQVPIGDVTLKETDVDLSGGGTGSAAHLVLLLEAEHSKATESYGIKIQELKREARTPEEEMYLTERVRHLIATADELEQLALAIHAMLQVKSSLGAYRDALAGQNTSMSVYMGEWTVKDDGKTIIGAGIKAQIEPRLKRFDQAMSSPLLRNAVFKGQVTAEADRMKRELATVEEADQQLYEKFRKTMESFRWRKP